MAAIIYALVANNGSNTPLAEIALAEGNFQLMALKLLAKVEKGASKSFTYENKYTFHYHNDNGFTFLCMTDAGLQNRTAYAFLFDIKDRFFDRYGQEAKEAIGLSANREFGEVLKTRMQYYNNDPTADKLKTVKSNIEKTKDIMIENIDKVLARGEKIELLVKKTEHMSDSAVSLRKQAVKVKRHMWWKNIKFTLILAVVLILVIFFIVVLACGGFGFDSCS